MPADARTYLEGHPACAVIVPGAPAVIAVPVIAGCERDEGNVNAAAPTSGSGTYSPRCSNARYSL